MKISWGTLYSLLIAGIIFVTPLNLFFTLVESNAYVGGLFVDYLVPKVYISNILIVGLFGCWLLEKRRYLFSGKAWQAIKAKMLSSRSVTALVIPLFAVFTIRQFMAEQPVIAVWQLISMMTVIGLFLFIRAQKKVLQTSPLVAGAFALTILFQSVIGLYQFFFQKSVAPYYFFGETQLSSATGIAKLEIQGQLLIAPYGTTSHPNVLGGALVFYLLITLFFYLQQPQSLTKKLLFFLTVISGAVTLLLTFSISAWIALLVGVLTFLLPQVMKKILGWGSLVFFLATPVLLEFFAWLTQSSALSVTRRILLNAAALNMWLSHLLVGVGLHNFTVHAEKYVTSNSEVVRFLQPTHHVGLLWLSETGVLGIMVIILTAALVFKMRKRHQFLPILVVLAPLLPIASLDHYLLTAQAGWLLLVWWVSFRYGGREQLISGDLKRR